MKQEQERLRETVAKLDDPAAAEKARAELEQGTPEMPQDASPEARAEAMQEGMDMMKGMKSMGGMSGMPGMGTPGAATPDLTQRHQMMEMRMDMMQNMMEMMMQRMPQSPASTGAQ